jgi:hypothetical protein
MGPSPRPIEKVPARAIRAPVDQQQARSSAGGDAARGRRSILIRATVGCAQDNGACSTEK